MQASVSKKQSFVVFKKSLTLQSTPEGSNTIDPDVSSLAKAISIILQSQIQEDSLRIKRISSKSPFYLFCEEKYIAKKQDMTKDQIEALKEIPTPEDIQDFICKFYECGQFSGQCCIICLIYVNRLIAANNFPFKNTTWRPVLLCALLVAQKVMDDNSLNNADFAYIYPFFSTEELNKLEAVFIELIQYNVTVKSSMYLRYYFDLRSLAQETEIEVKLPEEQVIAAQVNDKLDNIPKNYKEHYPENKSTKLKPEPTSETKTTKSPQK